MSETATATHHKIKAEWTKTSKNENFNSSSSESDRLEKIEDESEICKFESKGKIQILEQIVLLPSQKSVKCHYCDKNFDKFFLEEHQKIHEKTFFDCTECNKQFRRKSSLRKHFSSLHKGKFKYECTDCNIKFIDLTKYELHINTKHKTKETQTLYKCQDVDCNKTFASPEYLKRHQVTHNDEFKYHCTVCDLKFKWMTSLQSHQAVHTETRTFVKCEICLKLLYNQRSLERHQKIHQNLKFKCTLCEKVVSNRKDNIRRHIRHLHNDVPRSEIASKIAIIRDDSKETSDDEHAPDIGLEYHEPESIIIIEEIVKIPSPLPVINNRVKVIQSIGNPNKHQQIPQTETKPVVIIDSVATDPEPPQKPSQEIEIKLPPKKKAIALSQPSSSSSMTAPKAKYDPIQHYRKMLLGFSKDDEHPTTTEDIAEEEETDQEPQVFPIHWRKRTSQNFLFRR